MTILVKYESYVVKPTKKDRNTCEERREPLIEGRVHQVRLPRFSSAVHEPGGSQSGQN
jgi:hypothetical protein